MKGKRSGMKEVKKVFEKMREVEGKILPTNEPFRIRSHTLGQRAADGLTKWAGSWFFIIFLGVLIVIWMGINTAWVIFGDKWDPYPFILLNFILSTLAAVQAPIILMSQNREGQKDRARAEYDHAVNKKAEKEIREIKGQLDRIEKRMGRR